MKNIKIKRKKTKEEIALQVFITIFLTLVLVICVYPFWNIFIISINDATDAIRGGIYFLPRKLSLASYKDILTRPTFLSGIRVTVLRTLIGTPLSVVVTTALAYVISRKELLGKKQITLFFIFTMYFGGGLVPYYMVLKNVGLLNNFWVFILPNLVNVYNMILVKQYIENMPDEIFESAKIDGANDLIIFIKLVLPLSKPIIMTVALFVAITHWNSWFDAYLFTSSQSLKTLQSILVEILNQYQTAGANQAANQAVKTVTPDSIRMAATMVATIPIIMLYPFIQKYFIKGIMLGSVKS
ncbi:MAG TPA: carbohydrate ABC transporter permease [Epulopiscium sp.]|nr:carbohydrate ABC transporter permease [Candidatus Epulonipiscium sp.]